MQTILNWKPILNGKCLIADLPHAAGNTQFLIVEAAGMFLVGVGSLEMNDEIRWQYGKPKKKPIRLSIEAEILSVFR